LIGIAPFYIERRRKGPFTLWEIRFMGAPEAGSDYLDVFARRGREREVAEALYDFLMGEGRDGWDVLQLQDIRSDALFLLHFMNRIRVEGKHYEIGYSSFCPELRLPATEDELFAGLSASRKKKYKQDIRVINREQDVVHSVIRGGEVAGTLPEFFRLYEEKGGHSAKLLRPILQELSTRFDNASPVQLDLLSVAGRTVAGLLHLQYRNSLAMYLMAVDKQFNPKISLGNLLVGLCIKNSIAAGHDAYDFLRGEESYKFHWASGGRSTMQLTLWQKRPAAVACALARLARHAGKLLLR
jgi:hypothetical protein